jgi:hypothetical protein
VGEDRDWRKLGTGVASRMARSSATETFATRFERLIHASQAVIEVSSSNILLDYRPSYREYRVVQCSQI